MTNTISKIFNNYFIITINKVIGTLFFGFKLNRYLFNGINNIVIITNLVNVRI